MFFALINNTYGINRRAWYLLIIRLSFVSPRYHYLIMFPSLSQEVLCLKFLIITISMLKYFNNNLFTTIILVLKQNVVKNTKTDIGQQNSNKMADFTCSFFKICYILAP